MTLSSWAIEQASNAGIPFTNNQAVDIRCYLPGYTFVEKLQAVSTKYRKQQANGKFPGNFLRHYYDIYCLLGNADVQKFIGTGDYLQHEISTAWNTKKLPACTTEP